MSEIEQLIDKLIWAVYEETDDMERCHSVIREEIKPAKSALLSRFEALEKENATLQMAIIGVGIERDENVRLKVELAALKEATRWIPAAVPAPDGTFIEAWNTEEGLPFSCGAAFFNHTYHDILTHWRPLPQPPEPATDEVKQ